MYVLGSGKSQKMYAYSAQVIWSFFGVSPERPSKSQLSLAVPIYLLRKKQSFALLSALLKLINALEHWIIKATWKETIRLQNQVLPGIFNLWESKSSLRCSKDFSVYEIKIKQCKPEIVLYPDN